MFRIDFGWCILENVEELNLFVFLCAWAWACVCSLKSQLYSCIRKSVLEALHTWEWACVRGVLSAYAGFDLHTYDVWQKSYSAHFHLFFICFTSNPNKPFCHLCTWISPYPSFYLHFYIEKIIFHQFCLNEESNLFFLQSSSPCVGRGSTNTVVEWYNLFVPKTRAYIQEPGFEPIIGLLLEKFAIVALM